MTLVHAQGLTRGFINIHLQIETTSKTLGPFCGSTPPPSPFLTHSNRVHIRFTSDGFGINKGFNFHFKTRGNEASSPMTRRGKVCYEACWKVTAIVLFMLIAGKVCPALVTPHSTATPPLAEYRQGQTVTVTCDVGYFASTVSVQRSRTINSFNVLKPQYN